MTAADTIPLNEAIKKEILRQFDIPAAKYGAREFELLCIRESWGDTLDDRQTLRLVRSLNRTGSMHKEVICRI